MAKLAAAMEGLGDDHERLHKLGERYADFKTELESRLQAWERLTETLESA
jgi:hypothetical protein